MGDGCLFRPLVLFAILLYQNTRKCQFVLVRLVLLQCAFFNEVQNAVCVQAIDRPGKELTPRGDPDSDLDKDAVNLHFLDILNRAVLCIQGHIVRRGQNQRDLLPIKGKIRRVTADHVGNIGLTE